MLTEQRRILLLEQLRKHGRIVAKEMSLRFKLSEDTIRRDLRELAAEGKLHRVHGGALPASPTTANLAARRGMANDQKLKLGQAGAKLLKSGMSAFIDGGTTNLEMVRQLPLDLSATIFTHSPPIAAALEHHKNIRVIVIGGILFKHSMVSVGLAAIEMIQQLRADLFFLGVTGVHPLEGLTTGDYEEAQIKRLIASRSVETVTLVTSEKIGAVSAFAILPITALSTLIIDKKSKLPNLKKNKISVIRV
jgi:DeoR/GlpR family transcriptional regulator of sugar metabolism